MKNASSLKNVKNTSKNKSRSEKIAKKIEHLFAKRDYLAWRVVNLISESNPYLSNEFCEHYRLNRDKLLQQQAQHSERLTAVLTCQSAYVQVFDTMSRLYTRIDEPSDVLLPYLQKSFATIETAIGLQKINHLEKLEAYHYAFLVHGLSKNELSAQMKTTLELKNHLLTLAQLKQLDSKTLIEKSAPEMIQRLSETNNFQRIDIKRLREGLNARAEEVTQHYLGNPKTRSGSAWRYGANKGSLVVTVKGQKQGLWRDFQTNEGGDMLNLIQHATGITDFKEVLKEATRFAKGYSTYAQPEIKASPTHAKENAVDGYTLQKIQKAKNIYQSSVPIVGTLAEQYLREHRGITSPLYEKTFRFHPNLKNWVTGDSYPALLVVAREDNKAVCGIQAIFLDSTNAKKAPLGANTKLSRGIIGVGALVHPGKDTDKIALAEGVETALSIATAHPDYQVHVTFGVGNFAKVGEKIKSKILLICADNDGISSGTAKSVQRATAHLSQKGMDVWVAEPEKPANQQKWDFNDALKNQGISQVKKDLDNATLVKGITQEKIADEIKQHLNAMPLPLAHNEFTSHEKTGITPVKIDTLTFDEILATYVDMELEQTRLVNAMHQARLTNPKESKLLSMEVITHSNSINRFAMDAMNHTEIKTEIEKLKGIRPPSLAQRGGFIAIRERLNKGELAPDDRQIVVVQLRNKASDQSRSQMQDRDRGGRSR